MYLAYLDAGSGSQIAMAVVAGFAGVMVALKMWWRRATTAVARLVRRRQPADSADPADPAAPATPDREG